ncbi:MAG: carboxypeptidase-like regulatory domain-containing protein [Planctomycetota bacterium]|jgi:hypothetical protein
MRRFVLVVAALAAAGCEAERGVVCTEIFAYGVNVTVTDQADEPVTGAVLTLTDGAYSETMEELAEGEYAGAGERAGTYTLVVGADGFEPATIEGIIVDADECHVIPQVRAVTLSPS